MLADECVYHIRVIQILRGVFLGSRADAENTQLLRRIGITHAVNAAGVPKVIKSQRRYDVPSSLLTFLSLLNTFTDMMREMIRNTDENKEM